MTLPLRITCTALAVLVLAGCGGTDAKYNVLRKGKLHGEMWRLAELTADLDRIMRGTEPSAIPQATVVRILARIETSADRLAKQKHRHKHPLLQDNIDAFRRVTREARAAAAAAPPNYYFAGTIAGTCVFCHDPEGGIR